MNNENNSRKNILILLTAVLQETENLSHFRQTWDDQVLYPHEKISNPIAKMRIFRRWCKKLNGFYVPISIPPSPRKPGLKSNKYTHKSPSETCGKAILLLRSG